MFQTSPVFIHSLFAICQYPFPLSLNSRNIGVLEFEKNTTSKQASPFQEADLSSIFSLLSTKEVKASHTSFDCFTLLSFSYSLSYLELQPVSFNSTPETHIPTIGYLRTLSSDSAKGRIRSCLSRDRYPFSFIQFFPDLPASLQDKSVATSL